MNMVLLFKKTYLFTTRSLFLCINSPPLSESEHFYLFAVKDCMLILSLNKLIPLYFPDYSPNASGFLTTLVMLEKLNVYFWNKWLAANTLYIP